MPVGDGVTRVAAGAGSVHDVVVLAEGVDWGALTVVQVEAAGAVEAVVVAIELHAVGVFEENDAVSRVTINGVAGVAREAEPVGQVGGLTEGVEAGADPILGTVVETTVASLADVPIIGLAVGVLQLGDDAVPVGDGVALEATRAAAGRVRRLAIGVDWDADSVC